MLSDEEKEALRNFKSEYETCDHYSSDLIIELDDAEIILNLIEKQSKEYKKQLDLDYVDMHFVRIERYNQLEKEIEELKQDRDEYKEEYIKLQNARYYNYISKDKIKAKIEELEIEQKSNREDLKIAIDNLSFRNIDKIADKISINMSVREILQSLLEKEGE